MEVNNPLYRNQGIHVICSIFTVDNGVVKVLLIRRTNEPFKDMWALVGGALHNDEDLEDGLRREIYEKTGMRNLELVLTNVFGKVNRSPVMRMVAVSYVGVTSKSQANFLKKTLKTSDAEWFDIRCIPELAYDHAEIMNDALLKLRDLIDRTDILKSLFPNTFTLPELQRAYEIIWNKEVDRRNFRKKLIKSGFICDTQKTVNFEGKKPAKLYKFNKIKVDKNIF